MCPYSEPKSVPFESFLHAPRGNHRVLHPRGNETRGIDLCSVSCSGFVAIPRESKAKSGNGSTISIWTVPAIFTSLPRKWTPMHPRGAIRRSTGWSGATGKSRFWRARRDWRKVTQSQIEIVQSDETPGIPAEKQRFVEIDWANPAEVIRWMDLQVGEPRGWQCRRRERSCTRLRFDVPF